MAPRKSLSKSKTVAKIVTGKKEPCGFCQREVDDELTYGKLYAIGDIQCHYFCVCGRVQWISGITTMKGPLYFRRYIRKSLQAKLLSSCLVQKGKDEDGLFGFIYEDILTEIERAKKHRCSYCSRYGANLGCSVSQCRKQFHLPCGKERNTVSLFYGNYKTFCQSHAPKQTIPAAIMAKAQQRKICDNKAKRKDPNFRDLKELSIGCGGDDGPQTDAQSVCVICYEAVDGYPTINTFWPPCCARDAWFHRTCLQRMALSAGMHYLKCPLCNDKDNFYQAVVTQGYYVPDRDAAWELEQNAFAEIYDREISCSAADCACPMGRSHDADQGSWCIKLCLLCGSSGAHIACLTADPTAVHVCVTCTPAAPDHIEQLASCIEAVISQEQQQSSSRSRRGPVMPSRMSLRRTKRHTNNLSLPSCSSSGLSIAKPEAKSEITTSNTSSSRQDLNLKTPKKPQEIDSITNILTTPTRNVFKSTSEVSKDFNSQSPLKGLELTYISPNKLLEARLRNRMGGNEFVLDKKLVEDLRVKFRKPKPLSEKKKIVNDILNGVFDSLLREPKQKEPVKQWYSPKKCDIMLDVVEPLDDTPASNSNKENTKTPVKQENESEYSVTTPKRPRSADLILKFNAEPENTYPIFNSPKNLKTVDILKDSSLEISAKDEIINIDVIKIENSQSHDFLKNLELKSPEKSKKCAFKFSPYNKEVLDTENIDIDMESFKDRYLSEVGLQRVKKLITPDEINTEKKTSKRNRKKKVVLKYESKKRRKDRKNISIKNKNIKLKIKWRKEQFKLKITDSKKKRKKAKKYKQYILECSSQNCASIKPTNDFISPLIKKKPKKQHKTPDNLIQTSIQKFFQVKTPSKD